MHLELAAFTRKWVSAMEAVVEEVQAATPAREIIAGMFEAMAKAVREGQSG
jgi:truncated hemoglobin YjbI